MSTTTQPLKYLWTVWFSDDHFIEQSPDDRYSKHDDNAEWNPSAFRDIQDYQDQWDGVVDMFMLDDGTECYTVDLREGTFSYGLLGEDDRKITSYELKDDPLTDRKLIYYRVIKQDFIDGEVMEPYVSQYVMGYEGKNKEGKVEKKVIHIDG